MQLICITGGDGVGKSTLTESVKSSLASQNKKVVVCSIWDSMPFLAKQLGITQITKKNIQQYLISLTVESRLYFLFHAMKVSLDLCLKNKVDYILIDSYWYKYACSEANNLEDIKKFYELANLFPTPDLVIWANLDPEIQTARKMQVGFSDYEMIAKQSNMTPQEFFKKRVKKIDEMFTSLFEIIQNKIPTFNFIEIKANEKVERLTTQILNKLT